MPTRLIVRAAPFVLAAVAAAIWLRRRRPLRPASRVRREASAPPPGPSGLRAPEGRSVDIVTVVDDLLGASG